MVSDARETVPQESEAAPGFRYDGFDDAPGSTHELVVSLVPRGARVLEFGCATGYMSGVLRDRLGCQVVGVEIDPQAAERARAYCERVIVGDADELDLESELGGDRFDAVVFADVLEHLREPWSVLARVGPFLADGGIVVASVPNVAHGSVRLALGSGEFRYRPTGLLDESHLRFFTRDSLRDLFEATGYVVTHWLRKTVDLDETEVQTERSVPPPVRDWVAASPESTTYQFVVRAVPSDTATQLLDAHEQLRRAREELEELQTRQRERDERVRELERGEAALHEELEHMRRAHEVLQKRIVAERVAFAEGLAHFQASVYNSRSWRYTAPLRAVFRLLRRGE